MGISANEEIPISGDKELRKFAIPPLRRLTTFFSGENTVTHQPINIGIT
jgi:hypothetical protein